MRLLLVCLGVAGAVANASAGVAHAAPDPLAPGPLAVTKILYDDGTELVGGGSSTYTFPQAVRGELSIPAGTGPFGVIVLLHGRHQTCAAGGVEIIYPIPPCPSAPPASQSIDSYKGYDDLARALASHGYVVTSIDANGDNGYDINSQDGGALARAQTIALNLDRLARWSTQDGPAPVGSSLRGKIDLGRIGLMGHSRGGEGVTEFVRYSRERPSSGTAAGPRYPGVRAVMALAPIDFNSQEPKGVAWGTVLPVCDGDVFNMQGAWVYERTKAIEAEADHARVQFTVVGANHNWFNSIWTNDDNPGTSDSACSVDSPTTTRMTMDEQRRLGTALMSAFLRRYVGPEPAFEPYVTGEAGLPARACPTKVVCSDAVQVSHTPGSAARETILAPEGEPLKTARGGAVTGTGLTSLATCTPVATSSSSLTGEVPGECPANPTRSTTTQVALAWDKPSSLRIDLLGVDAAGFGVLALRAGAVFGSSANPDNTSQDFDVALSDAAGHSAVVGAADFAHGALVPSRGGSTDGSTDQRELLLGGIRIPLERFAGVDLAHLAALELRFGTRTPAGSLQLADVAFQERAPAAAVVAGGSAAPSTGPATCLPGRTVRVDLRRAVSRRLVRASARVGRRALRVDRKLRIRVPLGKRASVRVVVSGRLRGGKRVRRVVTVRACG